MFLSIPRGDDAENVHERGCRQGAMSTYEDTFHARLRKARKQLRLSQTEMAEVGGVGRSTQANYEAGERLPDAEYLARIAGRGADVTWIITGSVQQPGQTQAQCQSMGDNSARLGDRESTLVDNFRQLDEKAQKHVCWLVADIAELTTGTRTTP